ncbi:MAG: VWA domain-containing protein [Hyphomicrobiales bacterium]
MLNQEAQNSKGLERAIDLDLEQGKFAENVVHFGRILRAAGVSIGPSRIVDAVKAVEIAGVQNRDDLYWTLFSVMVSKREHHAVFDAAFQAFWRKRSFLENEQEGSPPQLKSKNAVKPNAAALRIAEAMVQQSEQRQDELEPDQEIDTQLAVSGTEALQSKDFAQMSADEISHAKRAMSGLVLPVAKIMTRRFQPAHNGKRIDLRKTMRGSLGTGGEWISPVFKTPKQITPPIVALCDISGSMAQYSRLFLHFLHALAENRRQVQSFVFGTQLTNVTRALSRKDPDEALDACGALVEDWSGGTRIATALKLFNRDWSRRVLGQGAIVLLITDGLERDSEEDLSFETERLRKSCRELIWLNPLLRYDGFEARASGVRAMLPFVDQFRSVHSLNAIADLCDSLSNPAPNHSNAPQTWLRKTG